MQKGVEEDVFTPNEYRGGGGSDDDDGYYVEAISEEVKQVVAVR